MVGRQISVRCYNKFGWADTEEFHALIILNNWHEVILILRRMISERTLFEINNQWSPDEYAKRPSPSNHLVIEHCLLRLWCKTERRQFFSIYALSPFTYTSRITKLIDCVMVFWSHLIQYKFGLDTLWSSKKIKRWIVTYLQYDWVWVVVEKKNT